MLQPQSFLRSQSMFNPGSCLVCGSRILFTSKRAASSSSSPVQPHPKALPPPLKLPDRSDEEFAPKPLGRPLGLPNPPKPGQNAGVDTRTWRERREDFLNYDKHIEKRKYLTKKISTPYFREWTNMRHQKGKTFISNPKLFKADRAHYFPNLRGGTLASPSQRKATDTTPVLQNRISIVSMFSSTWAERQARTFVDKKSNPELEEALKEGEGLAQRVDINVEENALKAGLIRLFMPSIRRRIPRDRHGRYFIVRRGITEDIRDAIGLLNSKVGYVYLLDGECKIRWAGSGRADLDEKEGLVKGVRKLVAEWKRRKEVDPVSEK